MRFGKVGLAAAVALSMASAPALAAAANPAAALSVSGKTVRSSASVKKSNELRGGFIIPLIAIVAVVAGIVAATSGGDNAPTSP